VNKLGLTAIVQIKNKKNSNWVGTVKPKVWYPTPRCVIYTNKSHVMLVLVERDFVLA